MVLMDVVRKSEKWAIDNSPLIFTAVGTAGVIATAFLTGKATFKAAEVLAEEAEARGFYEADSSKPYFTTKEKAQMVWKLYIPSAVVVVLSCGAIISSNQIGTRRTAALATAFTISEKAYAEYRDKVAEKLGAKKEEGIRDEIAQDRVNRDYDGKVIVMEVGKQLCYDSWSGRFFESDMESIKHAVNRLNYQINGQNYASLTDFYDFLGLPRTANSDEIGWNVDKLLDVHYTTTLAPSGKPAIAIEYRVEPVRNYFRLH